MNKIGLNDIREEYLSFFESKGHLRLPSFSLVPKGDNSLLLINAGMAPLKPYFTGLKKPPKSRITTCQKCIRTGDIENVGITSRHATFFEMLGNFSFGDYFKEEIIPWSWEFVTEVLQLPKDKLYVTIYVDDDEALKIWTKSTDIDPSRIFKLGKEENFWEIGQGPCGPCSEIHFDRGEGKITTVEEFVKASDEDRVVEFWNLVFTQFDKDENGNYNKLAHPNIDTGMGLERIATIMQGVDNIFEVDTMKNILNEVSVISGVKYGEDDKKDMSIRIITDHVRSITFMVGDGILPSNEGRGYILRRLLRRAARHGKLLGINDIFLNELCNIVIEDYGDYYSELVEKKDYIKKIIKLEEERFGETIDAGMHILEEYFNELVENDEKVLSGEKAFKLYDTFGFPVELTAEILEEKGISIDIDGFNKEMEDQRNRAREARDETNYSGCEISIIDKIPNDIETIFKGYTDSEISSKVRAIIKDNNFVDSIKKGDEAILIIENTPFYPEMGGQCGDTGIIFNEKFKSKVLDTQKNKFDKIVHFVEVLEGELKIEDLVTLKVDEERRLNISKHHTATHMLNEALREVLGTHVHQTGSYVSEDRLRFDFNHFSPMTEKEIRKVEELVNKKIMEVLDIKTDIMKLDEAKKSGAISLLNETYSEEVRVVSIGEYSKELCGGTHICNSGELGFFKIINEYGVAAGIRRIEAVAGFKSLEHINKQINLLEEIENRLKCSENDIINKIESQSMEIKDKERQISSLKSKLAVSAEDEILNSVKEVKGVKFVTGVLKGVDSNALRDLGDRLKDKLGDGLVVLGSVYNDKVQFVSMATKGAVSKGVHCGNIIKKVSAITDGNGGGRPNMAQAGGKNPLKLEEAINSVEKILEELL